MKSRATACGVLMVCLLAAVFEPVSVRGISSTVVISEFRVRGPNGGSDEFIELYNLSSVPQPIGGMQIRGSNNAGTTSARVTIAAGVPSIIASRLTEDLVATVVEGGAGAGSAGAGSATGAGRLTGVGTATGIGSAGAAAVLSVAGEGVAEPSGLAAACRSGFRSGRGTAPAGLAWDLLVRDLASSAPGTSSSGVNDAENTRTVTTAPKRLISLVDRSGLRDPAGEQRPGLDPP